MIKTLTLFVICLILLNIFNISCTTYSLIVIENENSNTITCVSYDSSSCSYNELEQPIATGQVGSFKSGTHHDPYEQTYYFYSNSTLLGNATVTVGKGTYIIKYRADGTFYISN